MDTAQLSDPTPDENLRRQKLYELERRQQALQRLCEEALQEDEVEKELPPFLSPPSGGGSYRAVQVLKPPPQRDPLTDDLLTGEVQSFRDPNSMGRASSLNSASRAPSAPQQSPYMPPQRSASRDRPVSLRPALRPFVPRSKLFTTPPPPPREQNGRVSDTIRSWSSHAGMNKTPMRGTTSEDSTIRYPPSTHRSRYFGAVDTPTDSANSPPRRSYSSAFKHSPPPPPPPAELPPPERSRSRPNYERSHATRVPPPPPRAERTLYAPVTTDRSDQPSPPSRVPRERRIRTTAPPPPPPQKDSAIATAAGARMAHRKAPTLSTPGAYASSPANPTLSAPLSLAEAYSRYAPPRSYKHGSVKHFFREETCSSAASVANSSFTSYFSSGSKVAQWRAQLKSNDEALEWKSHRSDGVARGKHKGIVSPASLKSEPVNKSKPEFLPPPPSPSRSGSEGLGGESSVWEASFPLPEKMNSLFADAPACQDVHPPSASSVGHSDRGASEEVSMLPPPPPVSHRGKITRAVPLHPYAANVRPGSEVAPAQSTTQGVPMAQQTADPVVEEERNFFDESPAKVALRTMLASDQNSSQPAPHIARDVAATVPLPVKEAPHARDTQNSVSPDENERVEEAAADSDFRTQYLKEKLQEAQSKAEALARHLAKTINEKTMLVENVKQLEEMVEESTFEMGRLQRVVVEQQKEHSGATEVLALLRAKEREIALYEDEIQRLNSAIERHLLRVTSASTAETGSGEGVHDVDAALTEVGAAYLAQREAEERSQQLAGELEAAVEQIRLLDERLADMERAQAASRLDAIRDVAEDGRNSPRAGPTMTARTPSAAEVEQWPLEARRMIAQLTAHAEGLLVQNSESARNASSVLRHANYSREDIQQRLRGRTEEVEILQDECARLQHEKTSLIDMAAKMRHQLKTVKEDAQLVSELVHTSRDEVEQMVDSCSTPAARGARSPSVDLGNLTIPIVKDFAQQVMRDFHAVSRFLAALREMDIEQDNGYEILVKLADGTSPSDKLYTAQSTGYGVSLSGATPNTDAQKRVQKRRDFVLRAVQRALVDSTFAKADERVVTPLQMHVGAATRVGPNFEEVTEPDAFDADMENVTAPQIRLSNHRSETDAAGKSTSIYRDDTGIVLSDVRKTVVRTNAHDGAMLRGDEDWTRDVTPPASTSAESHSGKRQQTDLPESVKCGFHDGTSPPTRVPFSVVDRTPPSVSRPLRLSSGTPVDAPDEAMHANNGDGHDEAHGVDKGDVANCYHPLSSPCDSSGVLSVSDIPFDNVEAEKNRQRRSREKDEAEVEANDAAAKDDETLPVSRYKPTEREEDDVSPVIRPPRENLNDDAALPDEVFSGHTVVVDLLGDDVVLPSEHPEVEEQVRPEVRHNRAEKKSPVPSLNALPPLAPSPQVTPSQLPISPSSPSGAATEQPAPAAPPQSTASRRHADDDDDDEDNEPSLFFYPDTEKRMRGTTDNASGASVSHQPPQVQPSGEDTAIGGPADTVRHDGAPFMTGRGVNTSVVHPHRAPPSAGVSSGAAALPRLQRSATASPQSASLEPLVAGAMPSSAAATARDGDAGANNAGVSTEALQEPHKASPTKPLGPQPVPDAPLTSAPEELSGVEDDMTPEEEAHLPQPILPEEIVHDDAADEEEPMRRSGTARPSSATHRSVHPADLDDKEDDCLDDTVLGSASPSPDTTRHTGNGSGAGLPSEPAHGTPDGLADLPLPAEPLSAPSKPARSPAASRPAMTKTATSAASSAPASLPRVNQDPPEPRLSLAREKSSALVSLTNDHGHDTAATLEGTPSAKSSGGEDASVKGRTESAAPNPVPLPTASPEKTVPSSDAQRQKRKEDVARILERLRVKKEEEEARKKMKEEKAKQRAHIADDA